MIVAEIIPLDSFGIVPLRPSLASYSFNTTVENVVYVFELLWCEYDSSWYLSVFTELNVPICTGIRLVLGIALGRRCLHPLFQTGVFVMVDLTGKGREATFEDLGVRVQMRRYSLDQILARQGFIARSTT